MRTTSPRRRTMTSCRRRKVMQNVQIVKSSTLAFDSRHFARGRRRSSKGKREDLGKIVPCDRLVGAVLDAPKDVAQCAAERKVVRGRSRKHLLSNTIVQRTTHRERRLSNKIPWRPPRCDRAAERRPPAAPRRRASDLRPARCAPACAQSCKRPARQHRLDARSARPCPWPPR